MLGKVEQESEKITTRIKTGKNHRDDEQAQQPDKFPLVDPHSSFLKP